MVIGAGGATGSTSGIKGGESSFGDYISSAGGSAANSNITSTKEGALTPIFNFIENTIDGAGGNVGYNGASGVCYMRIAMKL